MTKDIFLTKWVTDCAMVVDLEAVIAKEIAKSKVQPKPELNPIAEAYERGGKIRQKNWLNGDWIQKHNETKTIDNNGYLNSVFTFGFIQDPEKWELYTEPTEQPSSQVKVDNSFDKERFEAMFRAVVERGSNTDIEWSIKVAENAITKLDAYYASKNN